MKNEKRPNNENNVIGNQIRELRRACNLNQNELANEFYITRTCLSNYENGRRTPDMKFLYQFCEKFNVSINYILGRTTFEEEVNEFTYAIRDINKFLTSEGHLDLSTAPPLVKVFVVDIYLYLMRKYSKV